MTTPTKEQIEQVTVLACLKQKEISDCSECILASTGECDLDWLPYFTKEIINEWEKIKEKQYGLDATSRYISLQMQ